MKRLALKGILLLCVSSVLAGCSGKSRDDVPEDGTPAEVSNKESGNDGIEQKMFSFSMDGRSPNGVKQWHIEGNSAEIINDEIHLNNMGAVAYGEEAIIVLTSEKGIYNRDKGEVELIGNVEVTSDNGVTLTTDRAVWSQTTKEISTKEIVHIKKAGLRAVGKGGMANSDKMMAILSEDVSVDMEPDTKVNCDGPLEVDYNANVAVFWKNVQVEDKDGKLFSDKLTVEFNAETESFKQVIAEGNVKTKKGDSYTLSDKAVYSDSTKSAKLTGHPRVVIDPQEMSNIEGFGPS